MGGVGFIHYNNTIAEQLGHALRAKKHVAGCLFQPPTLSPDNTVREYDNLVVGRLSNFCLAHSFLSASNTITV